MVSYQLLLALFVKTSYWENSAKEDKVEQSSESKEEKQETNWEKETSFFVPSLQIILS